MGVGLFPLKTVWDWYMRPPLEIILSYSPGSMGLWSLVRDSYSSPPFLLIMALLSPTLITYMSSSTVIIINAHDPALFIEAIFCLVSANFCLYSSYSIVRKFSSHILEPLTMALEMSVGNSWRLIILLCRLSFKYSAHLLPPWPS